MQVREDDPERPWYEPGVYRVDPGIHRIPLPIPEDGLRAVNCFVLQNAGRLTIIDPGAGVDAAHDALRQGLATLDAGLDDVDRALVTHVHYDHYTQAVAIRERTSLEVWLGRHEEPSLTVLRDADRSLSAQVHQLMRYGATDLARGAAERRTGGRIDDLLREGPDRWVDDDETISVAAGHLRALHTPGHTRGHVVFRDDARELLFAGDHVLPTITPSIGFEAAPTTLPLVDYLRSLRAVRSAPDARLLPAHGSITPSVHARVDELLAHHDDRLRAVADAVGSGATTGLAVAGRLRWTRRIRTLVELDTFNRMLAILETGYHLDLLVHRGTLRVTLEGSTAHYALA